MAGGTGFLTALVLAACGSNQSAGTTTTSATTATVLATTVVGTTPDGQIVTETRVLRTTPTDGLDGIPDQTGLPLAAATTITATVQTETALSGTTTTTAVSTRTSQLVSGQTINGILCARLDQLSYQANVYLRIYVDGHAVSIPGGIGLVAPLPEDGGTVTTFNQSVCAYWLHTSAANGVIAIRSPVRRTFTLGDFFDIWGQPLDTHVAGPARGPVVAIVNGRRWSGDPRAIPLREHDSIELAVGAPVPRFRPLHWADTEL